MIWLVKLDQQIPLQQATHRAFTKKKATGIPMRSLDCANNCRYPRPTPGKPRFYPGKVWYRACFYYSRRSQHPPIGSWMIPRFLYSLETLRMKPALFVLCLLSTSAAFAQYLAGASYISSEPQIYQFASHPAHASYAPMSQEQNVLAATTYSSGPGRKAGFGFPAAESVSLGPAARELRQQHAQMKKSPMVWVNQ